MARTRVKPPIAKAKRSARAGRTPYQLIARLGYLSRGIVYCILGLIALMAAVGTRKNALSLTAALQELIQQPLGFLLVGGIAAGLVCFAFWRIAQGLLDADRLGTGLPALLRRTAYGLSSLAYFGIAGVAAGVVLRRPVSASDSSPRGWAAWLLSWPLGSVALGVIGFCFLGIGASTALRAYRARFQNDIDLSSSVAKWLVPIGCAGHGARSIIFLLVGYFLLASALHSDVHEVRDMAGALNVLQHQQFGLFLYSSVAVGLVCFGLFEFIQALFRKVGHRP
jgi:hypothetical protein